MIPPALIQVYPDKERDYTIICQFVDGKVTRYDLKDELTGVFEPLKNPSLATYFSKFSNTKASEALYLKM